MFNLTFSPNPPVMIMNNALADSQAQTGTSRLLPSLFATIKFAEYVTQVLFW
jgi:hypothetical protein